jgi:hypothetical protein
MKRISLILLLFIISITVQAQSIFNENFETTSNLITAGWKIYNDNNIPNNGYDSIFINGWEIVDWAEEAPNLAASTTSTFIDPAPANRWLVTPQIVIPANASSITLSFKARSFDVYPRQDGFNVKVSTSTDEKVSFTTTLLTVANAPNQLLNTVSTTEVDISAFAGQSIYLAWIDDFLNGNILAIDDIDITINTLSTTLSNTKKAFIYPNPSHEQVFIEAQNQMSEIKIYDMVGKMVLSQQAKTSQETVNTTKFSSGVYLLNILYENGSFTNQRLVIQ